MNSRTAFLRILIIASAIRERKVPITAFDLATELNVCHRTIIRDLNFLRDVGAPIFFDSEKHTWYWNPMIEVPWYFGGKLNSPALPLTKKQAHDSISLMNPK